MRKHKRWGLRTLIFLAIALVSVLVSTLQGAYTLLTLGGLLIGLIGATICSVRGLSTLK
jgi:hypothetical protein